MSLWNRTTQPELPQEVTVPMPEHEERNGGEVTAWAPRRQHNLHIGEAEDTVMRAAGVFKELKEQLTLREAQIADRDVRIGILEGRISDLELANTQLCNELTVSRTAENDAKHAASDWHALFQNMWAMMAAFEIGAQAPTAARRKAKGSKNGEHSVPVAQTETPISEAPKPIETAPTESAV